MPRKPADQQFDTLREIRDQAFCLFARFGYEGVSIGDIAKAAKLSKGALYWHYQGKEALYLECLNHLHTIFNQYLFDPMRSEPDPAAGILLLFHGLARLLQDPRVAHGVAGYWLVPSRRTNERILNSQKNFEASASKVIADTLRRGVEQGRFDYGDDLDDLARAIISLVEVAVLPLRNRTPAEVHGILGVLARTLFRAYAKPGDLLDLTRSL